MDPTPATANRRRIAIALAGVLLALLVVRGYHEFLLHHRTDVELWFQQHTSMAWLPLATALVTSSLAAVWARRRLNRRLVIPLSAVAGALTTAVQSSVTGTVVGACVGLVFTFDRIRRWLLTGCRLALTDALPALLLTVIPGLLGRMAHFAESPAAGRAEVPVYLVAALGAIVTGQLGVRMFRPPPKRWLAVRRGTALLLATSGLLIGLWLGWQLDVLRRVWTLQRVGTVAWWSSSTYHLPLREALRVAVSEGLWRMDYVGLNQSAQDRHVALLRGLPQLVSVDIEGARITDEGCRHLAALRELEFLRLYDVPIGDRGFRRLAGLPRLLALSVERGGMTRDAFSVLTTLPRLRQLTLTGVSTEGSGLERLPPLSTLRWVELDDCGLTDDDLRFVAQFRLVNYLSLRNNRIQGPGLTHLARGASTLATLDVSGNPLDDRHLSVLAGMSLVSLKIDGVRLSQAGCQAIVRLPQLEHLSARRSRITDDQLRLLGCSRAIVDADLDANRLVPRSFLGWRQRDVRVYVEESTVEAHDIQRLAELGEDVSVSLVKCEITPSAVAELAHHPRLFTLIDCQTQPRFQGLLTRHAYVRP